MTRKRMWSGVIYEFVAMSIFIYVGQCTNAAYALNKDGSVDNVSLNIAWAMTFLFGVQIGFHVSGGFFNPVLSVYYCTTGDIKLLKAVLYTIAQVFGAFCGSALAFATFYPKIDDFGGYQLQVTGPQGTGGVFTTFLPDGHPIALGVFMQVISPAIMMFFVECVSDDKNNVPMFFRPPMYTAVIMLCSMCLGGAPGYGVNPGRDFGGRMFLLCAGYGVEAFSHRSYTWWLITIFAPIFGGCLGGWSYRILSRLHESTDHFDDEKNCTSS